MKIIVSHVCSSSLFRVSWYVLCSMSWLSEYICTRLPFIAWSIAGVPSSQALLGYLITAPPSVCVPAVLGMLACGFNKKKTKKTNNDWALIAHFARAMPALASSCTFLLARFCSHLVGFCFSDFLVFCQDLWVILVFVHFCFLFFFFSNFWIFSIFEKFSFWLVFVLSAGLDHFMCWCCVCMFSARTSTVVRSLGLP